MAKQSIPQEVQKEIINRVNGFNQKQLAASTCRYVTEIKGKFIYLHRFLEDSSEVENICRLTYNGDINDMDFAIYKYSSDKYDPSEIFFDGEEYVDGTIEGAMQAGLEVYPID